MFKAAFQNFSDSNLVAFGFVLFIVTFIGALIWTLYIQKKSFYVELSNLPLNEGDDHGAK